MILLAFQARVIDWSALQLAWHDCCIAHRPRSADRMTLYRNGHDAAKMLVLIEYPNEAAQEAAREEEGAWQALLTHCLDPASIHEHVWEIMEHTDHAADHAVNDPIEDEGKQNKS